MSFETGHRCSRSLGSPDMERLGASVGVAPWVFGVVLAVNYNDDPADVGVRRLSMFRIKVLFLGLLAILAVGAVASTAASAHEWLICHLVTVSSEFKSLAECEGGPPGGTEKWDKKILSGEEVDVKLSGGTQTLTGSGVTISCSGVTSLVDLLPAGADNTLSIVYTGCAVTVPTGCGYVSSPGQPNKTIATAPSLPSKLVEVAGVLSDEVEENATSKEFVTLNIETAEGSGLPCGALKLTQKVRGSVVGKVNNAEQKLEFEGKSGAKELKIGNIPAAYSGTVVKLSPADKLTAD